MLPADSDLPALPSWQTVALEAKRHGVLVDATPESPVDSGVLQAYLEDRGGARLLALQGGDFDLLAPLIAAYADGGLGGRLLVVCGPSPWLGRAPFPVFVPADEGEAARLLVQALALSREFTTPVCLALPALPELPARQIDPAHLCRLLAPLPVPIAQPEVAEARAVALANHVEALGAWQLQRGADRRIGLLVAGPAWHTVRACHPASPCLRLDLAWPVPLKTIKGLVAISRTAYWVPGAAEWLPTALAEEGVRLSPWPGCDA